MKNKAKGCYNNVHADVTVKGHVTSICTFLAICWFLGKTKKSNVLKLDVIFWLMRSNIQGNTLENTDFQVDKRIMLCLVWFFVTIGIHWLIQGRKVLNHASSVMCMMPIGLIWGAQNHVWRKVWGPWRILW